MLNFQVFLLCLYVFECLNVFVMFSMFYNNATLKPRKRILNRGRKKCIIALSLDDLVDFSWISNKHHFIQQTQHTVALWERNWFIRAHRERATDWKKQQQKQHVCYILSHPVNHYTNRWLLNIHTISQMLALAADSRIFSSELLYQLYVCSAVYVV